MSNLTPEFIPETYHIRQQKSQVCLPPAKVFLPDHNNHQGFAKGQLGVLEDVGTRWVVSVVCGHEDHKDCGVHECPGHQVRGVFIGLLGEPAVRATNYIIVIILLLYCIIIIIRHWNP